MTTKTALVLVTPLIAALALAVPPARATEAPAAPVALKSDSVIDGELVTLGDIFHGLADKAATPIARAPAPGERIRLPARWLARVAQAYRLDWQPRSLYESVVVRRASTVVDGEVIRDAVLSVLRERGLDGELAVKLDGGEQRLRLPSAAAPTVAVTSLTYESRSGRFVAHLAAPDAEAPSVRATVTGEAVRMIEVPVLRRRIDTSDVIGKGDIEWAAVRADRLARNGITEADAVVGKTPRHSLRPGTVLRTSDLQRPLLVEKNDLITIELKTARMHLTAQGRAMQNGARGDVIRVVNTKSKSALNAQVVAPSTVVVAAATSEGDKQ